MLIQWGRWRDAGNVVELQKLLQRSDSTVWHFPGSAHIGIEQEIITQNLALCCLIGCENLCQIFSYICMTTPTERTHQFQENPKWRSVQARRKLEVAGEYGLRSLHLGWFSMQPRNFSVTTLHAP